MMNNMKKGIALLTAAACAASTMTYAVTLTDVLLTITGGDVTIGQTGDLDLGTFTISSADQDVSGTFTTGEEFWVEDLKGNDDGWYTTIQAGDMIGTNGTIPAANISMSVAGATVSLLA